MFIKDRHISCIGLLLIFKRPVCFTVPIHVYYLVTERRGYFRAMGLPARGNLSDNVQLCTKATYQQLELIELTAEQPLPEPLVQQFFPSFLTEDQLSSHPIVYYI